MEQNSDSNVIHAVAHLTLVIGDAGSARSCIIWYKREFRDEHCNHEVKLEFVYSESIVLFRRRYRILIKSG